MPHTSDQSQSLLALAAVVSPRVQIAGIRLSHSIARSAIPWPGSPLRIEHSLNGEAEANRESKQIIVTVSFMVRANPADGSDLREAAFHLEAVFHLEYAVSSFDGISDQLVQAFGKMNGVYNAWPYWREYVQSTTARMGFPPLTLPVLTGEAILKIYQEQEAAAKKDKDSSCERSAECVPAEQ
jgi:preprotein translocase subunit SecB